jgi:hypothetical protein
MFAIKSLWKLHSHPLVVFLSFLVNSVTEVDFDSEEVTISSICVLIVDKLNLLVEWLAFILCILEGPWFELGPEAG